MFSSIRQRLIFLILAGTFVIWSLVTLKIYKDAQYEISELFDGHLAQSAKVLLHLVAEELYEEHEEAEATDENKPEPLQIQEIEQHLEKHKYEKILAFQITVESLNFHFKSAIAPEQPLSGIKNGFSIKSIDGTKWRVFTLSDPEDIIIIRVGEPVSVRTELVEKVTLDLILPMLIALPILAFLIWRIIGHTLSPLNHLATKIKNRYPDQLIRMDSEQTLPDEVKPLLDALNSLLERLNETMENERRFTADAAHELRTPLAGIKTQAQLAMRTDDLSTRSGALQQIIHTVDRCTHMSEQLLAMARLDPDYTLGSHEKIILNNVIKAVCADLAELARNKQIMIDLKLTDNICIRGNSQTLNIMLRNLLDNAIRYISEHGRILIRLAHENGKIILTIDDDGPGIAEEMTAHVFNRFYRIRTGDEKGSGLGLSIAKRIADLHGAEIRLAPSELGGLRVEMIFSPAE